MDDMADKITELLADPDAMVRIKQMAETLFSGDNEADNKPKQPETGGFSLPDGFDPMKLMGIMSALNSNDNDNRAGLLLALKPHLTIERQQRVDRAVKLLKIASLLPILKEQGILDLF
jgi:hypothetical protein